MLSLDHINHRPKLPRELFKDMILSKLLRLFINEKDFSLAGRDLTSISSDPASGSSYDVSTRRKVIPFIKAAKRVSRMILVHWKTSKLVSYLHSINYFKFEV